MMRGVNKVFLLGEVIEPVILSKTQGGTSVARFLLETTKSWNNKAGIKQNDSERHIIIGYGKAAEMMSIRIKKGSRVFIEGEIKTREFLNKEKESRSVKEIVALQFFDNSPPLSARTDIERDAVNDDFVEDERQPEFLDG